MLTFLIILIVLAVGFGAWKLRVPLLAKILGQSEGRIDRRLNRRK